jgi:(+)-pinoresinol hydroxylase
MNGCHEKCRDHSRRAMQAGLQARRGASVIRSLLLPALCAAALVQAVAWAQPDAVNAERGAAVYEAWCVACHAPVPEGSALAPRAGVQQLQLKYDGTLSPYITQRPDLANSDVLRTFLRNGVGSMPPFRRTEISDEDIAALAAFFRVTSADPAGR